MAPQRLPFDRHSVSWRVAAEPVALLGGGRALLLQVAHPKVAAGVEQHSTYESDPWGRLFRTIDVMAKLAFARPHVAAHQARLLERMHRRVQGTTDDGDAYRALDPDLLLWVWATLCETALVMYELVHPPLSAADRFDYYEEWTQVAEACGVPADRCPATWDEFEAYVGGVVEHELRVTPSARKVAHATMVPPVPGPLRRPVAVPNQLVTVGLLPPSVREAFGFDWDDRRRARLDNVVRALRAVSRVTPAPVRQLGFRVVVARKQPLRFPWLQRHGARLTQARLVELERRSA